MAISTRIRKDRTISNLTCMVSPWIASFWLFVHATKGFKNVFTQYFFQDVTSFLNRKQNNILVVICECINDRRAESTFETFFHFIWAKLHQGQNKIFNISYCVLPTQSSHFTESLHIWVILTLCFIIKMFSTNLKTLFLYCWEHCTS